VVVLTVEFTPEISPPISVGSKEIDYPEIDKFAKTVLKPAIQRIYGSS